jgi:hypothetical protein
MIFSDYTGLVWFGWAGLLGYAGTLCGAPVVLPPLLGIFGGSAGGEA